jgi:hypothetical protein
VEVSGVVGEKFVGNFQGFSMKKEFLQATFKNAKFELFLSKQSS